MRKTWLALCAVVAAVLGFLALLVGQRRRGAAVGRAEAKAEADVMHVKEMVADAEEAAGPTGSAEDARRTSEDLRNDVLRRVRR
jgi:hypothetical protein